MILLCLVAVLCPFLAAVAVLEGVRAQAQLSVEQGADIYVTMDMYGRNGIIPQGVAPEIGRIQGVDKAVPRVVSRIYVHGILAVLLGLSMDDPPQDVRFVSGALPRSGEVAVGRQLAERLGLEVGDSLSIGTRVFAVVDHIPFVEKKVYRVSGVFDSKASIWTADLVLMDLEDAVATYEMEDFVTDIAVYVRPGRVRTVAEEIRKQNAFFRIQTKGMVRQYVEQGFRIKGGVFTTLYALALALGVPLVLVLSGLGLSERRRTIGVLKAAGWQTEDVLEAVFFENLILSLTGALGAFVLAFVWVRLLNAPLIARLFLSGAEAIAPFAVPARFLPGPLLLAVVLSLALTLVGSIPSTWRAAAVPPAEAMR